MLLDSNVIIWWMQGNVNLGVLAKRLITANDQTLIVSIFTLFEIELKQKTGKLRLSQPVLSFLKVYQVRVYSPSAEELPDLFKPIFSHKDPFDHAIIGLGALKSWSVMASDQTLLSEGQKYVKVVDSRK